MGKAGKPVLFGVALVLTVVTAGWPYWHRKAEDDAEAGKEAAAPLHPLDLETISVGEEVDVEAALEPGAVTAVVFTAEW